ncbi:MAG: ComF family protein [Campylobacteraceae bacterium]|nr:ComF family protein [Campylobacteraceae bacterium]
MRCLNCANLSFFTFCKECKKRLSIKSPSKRVVDDLNVYSFYSYDEVKHLIHSKHHLHGLFVYRALANLSFKEFAKEFKFGEQILALPIDDDITTGYSHTAILARSLKNKEIKPKYGILRASSKVKYSGKSLEFRQKHKRGFKILEQIDCPVILVDDIITTGTTLAEANKACKEAGVRVLFALTLADARE